MPARTARRTDRASLYGSPLFEDSALDDAEAEVFATAYGTAVEKVTRESRRATKRERAASQRVAGKRAALEYEPIDEEIQDFLAAHPAF